MKVSIQTIITELEKLAPLAYAESFDNVGLIVGDKNQEIEKALICLDCLETVIDEAIEEKAGLIIAFHPIVFSPLKKITGKNYVERVIIKAIQHNIAIYAIHTNLDFAWGGSNHALAEKLGLQEIQLLIPKQQTLKKIQTYVPITHAETVKDALFQIGVGTIGAYSESSFSVIGEGTFKPLEGSNPFIGETNKRHYEKEQMIQMIFPFHLEKSVIDTLLKTHPYETVAYEITTLDNPHTEIGIGVYGMLKEPMDENAFLHFLKETLPTESIRHSNFMDKKIQKVALLGGSGSFGIQAAKAINADAYISADFKYHDFFQAESTILLCDVGHFECEQHIKLHLLNYLSKKIINFAFTLSKVKTNPVNYI